MTQEEIVQELKTLREKNREANEAIQKLQKKTEEEINEVIALATMARAHITVLHRVYLGLMLMVGMKERAADGTTLEESLHAQIAEEANEILVKLSNGSAKDKALAIVLSSRIDDLRRGSGS